jgi:L-cystine uptake protein TcyP (sodium:dicarboxylate symporter family)
VHARPDCRSVRDPIVGASLLAMNVQTTRSSRQGALSLTSIASRLAPTGKRVRVRSDGRPPRLLMIVAPLVGASMLAMNLRAPRGVRCPASSLTTIAILLAPTGKRVRVRSAVRPPRLLMIVAPLVGASLLAMNLRAPRGVRCPASSLTTIAILLAPTVRAKP